MGLKPSNSDPSTLSKGPISRNPLDAEQLYAPNNENFAQAGQNTQATVPRAGDNYTRQGMKNEMDLSKQTPVDSQGNIQLGTPKVYDSVGAAGSGFVNMSHLLGLNKDSGTQSANDLARRTKETGQNAQGGIGSLEGQFNSDVADSAKNWGDPNGYFDPGAGQTSQDRIDAAKGAKYTGPNDLTAMSAYGDLSKKVSDAQNMARNSQSGMGMAAQINKDTGLSATQSAAGAFYMGVNNPNVKRAGSPFTNLSAALDKANSRAMNTANLSRQWATTVNGMAPGWQADKDEYDKEGREYATRNAADVFHRDDEKRTQDRNDQTQRTDYKNHETHELHSNSDEVDAVNHGVPGYIARHGVSYDDWVAMGSPSEDQYKKDHPDGN